ncbi:MAG TPA: fatty acid--CoA ligase family protein [Steroidobacteraceae bacterium]|nr:fatty acid--CoA ligase family protein [Steroidobacteraceae bacterium]
MWKFTMMSGMWLWETLLAGGGAPSGSLRSARAGVVLGDLVRASSLGGRLEELRGRCILLSVREQLSAALALIELDGVAQRVVLCPPDLPAQHLRAVIAASGADACVHEPQAMHLDGLSIPLSVVARQALESGAIARRASCSTEWVLLTSGTTGVPKLVLHTLATLMSAIVRQPRPDGQVVWSTFYDIRRYGGLQIFLRALRDGSMVLSSPGESIAAFLARAGEAAVTHISGTPSHWRQALMSGAAGRIAPSYVRLSGEIADQGILDSLRAAYPKAQVAHAFASTEAGVAFEVQDGRAGFPADLLGGSVAGVEMQADAGTLRIRSEGNALGYLREGSGGIEVQALKDREGFVDTGDQLEMRDGRCYFAGRSGGVINVGGLKVHPEEVEAAINAHPWVRMSLVHARRNPITGAIVEADVVLLDPERANQANGDRPSQETLSRDILEACRRALPSHKVPARIRFVAALEVSASGKLVRPNA